MATKKKELTFKEKLEAAKKKDFTALSYEVKLDEPEIGGEVINCYPLLTKERSELFEAYSGEDEEYIEWALIIICYKDDKGERIFSKDDIPFLVSLGDRFRNKLHVPAMQLSGLTEDFKIIKKHN